MAQQNRPDQPQSVYASEQLLRQALSNYLLTYGESRMGKLIDQLVNLYRNRNYDDNEPVWLSGDPPGFFRDSLTNFLKCWEIRIHQGTPPKGQQLHLERVDLPTLDQRRGDLPLIIAYFFQESLRRRKGAVLPEEASVKYVSLDLLWFLLGYPAWEGFERLRNVVRRSIRNARNDTLTLHEVLNSCRDLFPVLKGFLSDYAKSVPNPDNWRQVLANVSTHHLHDRVRGELVGWYLNWDTRERHRIIDDSLVPRIRVDFICQATTNLIHLFKIGSINEIPRDERNKVEKCFKLRRDSLSEKEIADQLDFEPSESYDQWTERNHINIRFRQKDTVYDDWKTAEKSLGIHVLQKKAEDLYARTALQQQPSATSKSEADVSGAEEQETSVKDTRADVATGEQQSQLPVVEVHASTEQVWIDGQQVSVRGKKHDRLNALIYWILEQQKTGKPVESFRILKAAKVEKKSIRVDHLYGGTPIKPLIRHPGYGQSWLDIDLAKSKVS